MNISKQINENTAVIALEGWLDTKTAPDLSTELDSLEASVTSLVLDFEKLEYISSAGLRVIVSAYKKMGEGNLRIINVAPAVMEVFKMTGFDQKLDIE